MLWYYIFTFHALFLFSEHPFSTWSTVAISTLIFLINDNLKKNFPYMAWFQQLLLSYLCWFVFFILEAFFKIADYFWLFACVPRWGTKKALGIATNWEFVLIVVFTELNRDIETPDMSISLSALLCWLIIQQQNLQSPECRLMAWVPALRRPSGRRQLQIPNVFMVTVVPLPPAMLAFSSHMPCVHSPGSVLAASGPVLSNHTTYVRLTVLPFSGAA